MNRRITSGPLLAALLLALAAFSVHAQQAPPATALKADASVDDIISGLEGDKAGTNPATATRALRPGAAAAATMAPQPAVAPRQTAISVQINFDFNSDRISGNSQAMVDNLATAMQAPQLGTRSFTVIGHTDGKGSLAYNQALSERRALAVKRELIRQGVPAARLNSAGKGMSELLNANDPYASENRRVEIRTGN